MKTSSTEITIPWRHFLNCYLHPRGEFPEDLESHIIVGHAVLTDSPEFLTQFLAFVSEKTQGFKTYEELLEVKDSLDLINITTAMLSNPSTRAKARRINSDQVLLKRITRSTQSYINYINQFTGETLSRFISTPQPIWAHRDKTAKHSLITGGSGSGKSEQAKNIIDQTIARNPDSAILIIDPHSELSLQIAQWKSVANSGRLVYIDPHIFPDAVPTLNPLGIKPDPQSVEPVLNTIMTALSAVMGENAKFTQAMGVMLKTIIKYLLIRPEPSTFDDLNQFILGGPESQKMRDDAIDLLTNPNDAQYIKSAFGEKGNKQENIGQTKMSIQTRLMELLGQDLFRFFLCADTSFPLEDLIARKKIIVVSLKERSGSTAHSPENAIGKFIFSTALSIAIKHHHTPGFPRLEAFVDESQLYAVETVKTVLTEARKYGYSWNCITQSIKNFDKTPEIKKAIQTNTFMKYAGFMPNSSASDNASLVGVTSEEISALRPGEFFLRAGDLPTVKIVAPAHLLGSAPEYSVTDSKWDQVLQQQRKLYYRDIASLPLHTPPELLTRKEVLGYPPDRPTDDSLPPNRQHFD